jgi:phosphate transport system substrate-binding protein
MFERITARRIALLLAAAALAMTAAACGGDDDDSSSSAESVAADVSSAVDSVASQADSAASEAGGESSAASSGGSGITGAGATFPEPIYSKWAGDFAAAGGFPVNYQGVGSGAGIEQFTAKTVDFGATDAPMNDDEIAAATEAGGEVLHIPTVLGSVAVTYNLPGIDALKLDGETLANIYLGNITNWNDDAIAALNEGVELPDTPITVVHRSDGSGTSYVFTGYLSKVSSDWSDQVGQDKEPDWPTGEGAEKNDGVAAQVSGTEGAIGYNELAYAIENNIPVAQLKNQAGEFVAPTLESTTKAGEGVQYPADLRFDLLDSATSGAYPIVTATWLLVWKDPSAAGQDAQKAKDVQAWLKYALGDGQASAPDLNYAPLPADLLTAATAAVDSMAITP